MEKVNFEQNYYFFLSAKSNKDERNDTKNENSIISRKKKFHQKVCGMQCAFAGFTNFECARTSLHQRKTTGVHC